MCSSRRLSLRTAIIASVDESRFCKLVGAVAIFLFYAQLLVASRLQVAECEQPLGVRARAHRQPQTKTTKRKSARAFASNNQIFAPMIARATAADDDDGGGGSEWRRQAATEWKTRIFLTRIGRSIFRRCHLRRLRAIEQSQFLLLSCLTSDSRFVHRRCCSKRLLLAHTNNICRLTRQRLLCGFETWCYKMPFLFARSAARKTLLALVRACRRSAAALKSPFCGGCSSNDHSSSSIVAVVACTLCNLRLPPPWPPLLP